MSNIKEQRTLEEKKIHRAAWLVITVLCLLIVQTAVIGVARYPYQTKENAVICYVYFVMEILTMMLVAFSLTSRYEEKSQINFFVWIAISGFMKTYTGLISYAFTGDVSKINIVWIFCSASYVFGALYLVLFWFYLRQGPLSNRKENAWITRMVIVFGVIYAALVVLNYFNGWIFYIDENAQVIFGIGDTVSYYIVMLVQILYFWAIARKKDEKPAVKWALMSYAIVPAVANGTYLLIQDSYLDVYDSLIPLSFVMPLYFIFFNVFQERGKDLIVKDKDLSEAKVQTMTLQINPHFIYNTLGSISSLCDTDPQKAKKMIEDFSSYLRGNHTRLNGDPMIPFETELDLLNKYIDIEQVRFPNITVSYELKAEGFYLPCLILQPIVENSIKHGICKRRKSTGNICIRSWEEADRYVVSIRDDGVGFDQSEVKSGVHIGLDNVAHRLQLLCNGGLSVSSVVGEGTVVKLFIPKNNQQGGY